MLLFRRGLAIVSLIFGAFILSSEEVASSGLISEFETLDKYELRCPEESSSPFEPHIIWSKHLNIADRHFKLRSSCALTGDLLIFADEVSVRGKVSIDALDFPNVSLITRKLTLHGDAELLMHGHHRLWLHADRIEYPRPSKAQREWLKNSIETLKTDFPITPPQLLGKALVEIAKQHMYAYAAHCDHSSDRARCEAPARAAYRRPIAQLLEDLYRNIDRDVPVELFKFRISHSAPSCEIFKGCGPHLGYAWHGYHGRISLAAGGSIIVASNWTLSSLDPKPYRGPPEFDSELAAAASTSISTGALKQSELSSIFASALAEVYIQRATQHITRSRLSLARGDARQAHVELKLALNWLEPVNQSDRRVSSLLSEVLILKSQLPKLIEEHFDYNGKRVLTYVDPDFGYRQFVPTHGAIAVTLPENKLGLLKYSDRSDALEINFDVIPFVSPIIVDFVNKRKSEKNDPGGPSLFDDWSLLPGQSVLRNGVLSSSITGGGRGLNITLALDRFRGQLALWQLASERGMPFSLNYINNSTGVRGTINIDVSLQWRTSMPVKVEFVEPQVIRIVNNGPDLIVYPHVLEGRLRVLTWDNVAVPPRGGWLRVRVGRPGDFQVLPLLGVARLDAGDVLGRFMSPSGGDLLRTVTVRNDLSVEAVSICGGALEYVQYKLGYSVDGQVAAEPHIGSIRNRDTRLHTFPKKLPGIEEFTFEGKAVCTQVGGQPGSNTKDFGPFKLSTDLIVINSATFFR